MLTDKVIAGNRISETDPMPVRLAGTEMVASGTPDKVSVDTTSTEIVAADPDRTWSVLVQVYSGGPVFLREGDDATADDWPLATGAVIEHTSTEALNGIVASGSADVRTWPNGS